ncbi:uncharacterized protein isoform X2 [Salmo salar]|uniref:Uncharacterized protein isoform X2 n=1 Tax=Salmo salar TaxID=8030 RepID=A0ABM3D5T1_SALSA|nr:uncharacterized protein LOC106574974 isoform X2 [Salmo salar]
MFILHWLPETAQRHRLTFTFTRQYLKVQRQKQKHDLVNIHQLRMNTYLIILCILSEVSVNVVARGDTRVDFNADASYTCTHADSTGVLQVTWQRLFKDDSVENLATYSKRFGAQIIDPHRGKVVFTEASLNSTSITVKNVTWSEEACYICSFNVYPSGSIRKQTCLTIQGLSHLVRTQQVVTATLGEDAVLNCELMTPKDVRQVTWQKVTTGTNENVASYSKHGPNVNLPFKGKVEFEDEGLQNCSIVIRGVSRGDECCYKCLFNTFPEGAISGRTCLKVHELYGPSLLITQTNNSHTTLSCSATGRPAPIVTWDDIMIEHSTMVDVTHPNGTVTMTTTVTVLVSSLTNKEVRCVASLSFGGSIKAVSEVIPASDQASFAGKSQVSDDDRISGAVVGSVMGSVCLISVFCVVCLQKRKKKNSSREKNIPDPEISKTPLKTQQNRLPSKHVTPSSSPSQMSHLSTSSSTKRRMTKNTSFRDTSNSSPSMIQSLSSSAKRTMHQAQEAVKNISSQESDDGVTRNLLEDDDY